MLKKSQRLTEAKDFLQVYRRGRPASVPTVTLKIARNNLGLNRYGFVIGVKAVRKATARALVKRRLRHLMQRLDPRLKQGFDCVFLTRAGVADLTTVELSSTTVSLLKRARLLA